MHDRLRVFLLLIIVSSSSAKLDLATCSGDTQVCYVDAACLHPGEEDVKNRLERVDLTAEMLAHGDCAVSASIKKEKSNAWVLRVQVALYPLDAAKGLHLHIGTGSFSCLGDNHPKAETTFTGLKIGTAGKHLIMNRSMRMIECEMEVLSESMHPPFLLPDLNSGKLSTSVVFHTTTGLKFTYTAETVLREETATCDRDQLVLDDPIPEMRGEYILQHPTAFFKTSLMCADGMTTAIHVKNTTILGFLKCATDEETPHYYVRRKTEDDYEKVPKDEKIAVFCGYSRCTQCTSPHNDPHLLSLPMQSQFIPVDMSRSGACVIVTCPPESEFHIKFEKVEGYSYTPEEPVCRYIKTHGNSRWMLPGPSGLLQPVEGMVCVKKYNCSLLNPIANSCPEGEFCGNLKRSSRIGSQYKDVQTIQCENNDTLRVQLPGRLKSFKVPELICMNSNGHWAVELDYQSLMLPKDTNVFCARNVTLNAKVQTLGPLGIALFSCGGALLLCTIAAVIWYCCFRKNRKREAQQSIKKRPTLDGEFPGRAYKKPLDSLKDWDDRLQDRIIETWFVYSIFEKAAFVQRCCDRMGDRTMTIGSIMRVAECVFLKETDYRVFEALMQLMGLLLEMLNQQPTSEREVNNLLEYIRSNCKRLLTPLGWLTVDDESSLNSLMRVTLLRFLLITDDDETIRRLIGIYDVRHFDIESPLRLVVWIAAVRFRDHFHTVKEELEREVSDRPFTTESSTAEERFGTKRTHLLQALCSYRNLDRLRDFIGVVCNKEPKPVIPHTRTDPTTETTSTMTSPIMPRVPIFTKTDVQHVFWALGCFPEGRRLALDILIDNPGWLHIKIALGGNQFKTIVNHTGSFIIDTKDLRRLQDMVFCNDNFNKKHVLCLIDFKTMTTRTDNRQDLLQRCNADLLAWHRLREANKDRKGNGTVYIKSGSSEQA